MKLAFIALFFISFTTHAQSGSDEAPFTGIIDLTRDVGDVLVAGGEVEAGQQLQNQAIDLANLAANQRCNVTAGLIDAEITEGNNVTLPAYAIPGAPYNDQIAALAEANQRVAQIRDQIYPFVNLLESYARNQNVDSFNDVDSTDLATRLSQYAATTFGLHLPKGLLLVETIRDRFTRNPNDLAKAFSGVSKLTLTERADIIHNLAGRVSEDLGAGDTDLSRTTRVAQYFSNSGLSEGYILHEENGRTAKFTIIVRDAGSNQFIRYEHIPLRPQINRSQSFLSLNGTPVTAEQVSSGFRPIITAQLTAEAPRVWSEYQPPRDTRVTAQLPTAVEVTPTPSNDGQQVAPVSVTGITNPLATPTPTYELSGPAGVTITQGTIGSVQTYSPTQIRTIDTNITTVQLPDYRNPNSVVNKPEGSNPLGLVNPNQPRGGIVQTTIATNAERDGVSMRIAGSEFDGQRTLGGSSLLQTDQNGSSIQANGFFQQDNEYGFSGQYRADANSRFVQGRSFFTLDTSDNSDPENPVRGIRMTAVIDGSTLTNQEGTTSDLRGTIATDIPIGTSDTLRTAVTLDDDDGISNATGIYSTNVTDNTRLSVAGSTGTAGDTVAARIVRDNTTVTASTGTDSDGNRNNTVSVGQGVTIGERVRGYGLVQIQDGDLQSSVLQAGTIEITPGAILSEDGRVIVTVTDSDRFDANGVQTQDQTTQSFTVIDTISDTVNFDITYLNTQTETQTSSSNRDQYSGRVTYGVDRDGNPINQDGGFVASLGSTYTQERTIASSNPKTGEAGGLGQSTRWELDGTAGYSARNRENGSSFRVDGGYTYMNEVITQGGTIVSTTDSEGFRLSGEYVRGYERASASCSQQRRRMFSAAGETNTEPVSCTVSYAIRF